MPDYGHPLHFGTFIQPSNQQPELTVSLAQLSEELGYDLVTFQDHPYQPAYLDTWTLMTWVAARTMRIHIASNVLNLPLRPPAVIARAAASLDLLSAGRFDLGLGAGGCWDAIEAMGGRRLSPGQSIEALDEAMDVIRGIWAAGERAPLRLDGAYYPLRGAKRGPAPAQVFDATDTAGFFERWGAAVEAAPREVTSFVILGPARGGQPPVAHVMVAVDAADADTVLARLQPFAEIAPLGGSDARITSYAAVMANASPDPHQGPGEPVTRAGLIRHITPEFAVAIEKLMATGIVYFFQIRSLGGAVADVPPDATAFGHRDANFAVVAFGTDRARLDEAWEDMYRHFRGVYLSFETDTRTERLGDAFPAATLERLRALKERYDPDNVFRDNFNIAPPPGLG